MDSRKKLYISLAMNIFIFLATTGVVISYFFGNDGQYHIEPSFRFNLFTTDSNILCGVSALIMAVFQIRQIKNNKSVPRWAFILKYTGTCALAVTFFTVIFFLGPSMGFMEMVFGGTSIYIWVISRFRQPPWVVSPWTAWYNRGGEKRRRGGGYGG